MAGVACYRPDGADARLAFHLREGAYDTDQLIPIVQALGRLLGGAVVTLVWDNLPAHHSLAMQAWLEVEYLPPYAPDLNPLEGLWANLKGGELANRACRSLEELAAAAEQGIGRVRGESELLFSFLDPGRAFPLSLDPLKRTYEMTRLRWSEALSRPLGPSPIR
jgi:transposase